MREVIHHNRRAVQVENDLIRVTVTVEGGHVAEILHKPSGVNPLWTPPWPSIEPSTYDPVKHPEYGSHSEAQLLSGILGHNICLDTFGAPSSEESAAGMPVHGEAAVARYEILADPDRIAIATTLSKSQLRFERRIYLDPGGKIIRFSEAVENLSPTDRPIGWTQHVTLGPPFLERGLTHFRASATRSKAISSEFNNGKGRHKPDAEFDWPLCPTKDGGLTDFEVFTAEEVSGGFTAHLMNPAQLHAWFVAWSPSTKALFGYTWRREDFPWMARWEENHLRIQSPWNGRGLACGMEFGVSPFVESRREMVTRSRLFGTPTFRWAPARSRLEVNYCAFIATAKSIPESVTCNDQGSIEFEF